MDNAGTALIEKIAAKKKERNAVILAHNCQLGEVQDIADFVGDSMEVALKAAEVDAPVVVIAGVQFIAEMAHILAPQKTILSPDLSASCSMVGMITPERLAERRKKYPNAKVVSYIKSPAWVKAESDICVTATNAADIVRRFDAAEEIMFIPDEYLGDYVSCVTDRDLILWQGYCPSAVKITPEDIAKLREQYPNARLMVHLESTPQVRAIADYVGNTTGMIRFARESDATEFIVGSETGFIHRLQRDIPGKCFIPANEHSICVKMKLINLETVLWSLETMTNVIALPDDVRERAGKALRKMMEAA